MPWLRVSPWRPHFLLFSLWLSSVHSLFLLHIPSLSSDILGEKSSLISLHKFPGLNWPTVIVTLLCCPWKDSCDSLGDESQPISLPGLMGKKKCQSLVFFHRQRGHWASTLEVKQTTTPCLIQYSFMPIMNRNNSGVVNTKAMGWEFGPIPTWLKEALMLASELRALSVPGNMKSKVE